MEVYDILFFDWVLLCHSNFFPHFYPEVKGIAAPQLFGYNKKAHLTHSLLYIPSPPPSRGFARFFEVQFHIKI